MFAMLTPFFDPSPYKGPSVCLKKIKEEFHIKIRNYSYLKWAFGNDVFLVNDCLIFRFPRTQPGIIHLKYEIELLNYLGGKVRVPIPHYTYISKRKDFAGYKIVSGNHLTSSRFKILSKHNKNLVINQLTGFVNELHSISVEDFKKFKPLSREEFIEPEKKIEQALKEKVFPKLAKDEVDLIEDFYSESKKVLSNIPHLTPIHGDLYAYNIMWDKTHSQTGVIDFSDYQIGDPAKDFEVFYDYGEESVKIAYEKYQGPKDAQFLKRAKIYYQVHGIYTLLSSLLGAQISFEYAYKNFFKRKFNL